MKNSDSKKRRSNAQPRKRASARPRLVEPTPEEIRQRAYEIFQRRGGTHGNDVEDWLQAEQELRAERKGKSS